MTVALVPMDGARAEAFLAAGAARFAEDLARERGVPAAELRAKVDAHIAELLTADGNRTFDIVVDGDAVGGLWVGFGNGPVPDAAYVFDVFVRADARGRGHGSAALSALEPLARQAGCARVALSVFAHNTRAIRLYERLGYAVILADAGGQRMAKPL